MKKKPAIVLLTAATLLASCKSTSSTSGTPGEHSGGTAVGTTDHSAATANRSSEPTDTGQTYDGIVDVTMRGTNGTDRVSCSDIHSEFLVRPQSGTIRWTATAHDIDISFANGQVRALLPGITVSPAEGLDGPGQNTLVRVTGSVDPPTKRFWIWVVPPNRTGSGGVGVEFTCIGR